MSPPRVLITGAGSGLGRALAQRYARAGYAVACADIRADTAEATLGLLPGSGHLALAVDVADDASVAALERGIADAWGDLDVLVNNAGVASGGSLLDSTLDEWRWVLEINLLGVVRCSKAFVPWLLRRGRGQVINIASFAGLAGAPCIMSYGASKAAVVALSEQLRAEVEPDGVQVAVVCPSFFQTNLLDNFRAGDDGRMRQVAARMMAKATLGADDVAEAIYAAAARGEFLILPIPADRWRWRTKRWFPRTYFRRLLASTRWRRTVTDH